MSLELAIFVDTVYFSSYKYIFQSHQRELKNIQSSIALTRGSRLPTTVPVNHPNKLVKPVNDSYFPLIMRLKQIIISGIINLY
jgi:hypothetical protein